MGLVYGDYSFYDLAIDGATSASLRAGLDRLLIACTWMPVRDLVDGRVYLGTSPQARQVKLFVQDLGDVDQGAGYIRLWFTNVAEDVAGSVHPLVYRPGRVYSAVACECQLFVWLGTTTLGLHTDGFRGYDFAGGIPYVPEFDLGDPCGGYDPLLVSDIFWSCSSGLGGGGSSGTPWGGGVFVYYDYYSFRNHYLCGSPWNGVYGVSCGYENGIVYKYDGFSILPLQLRLIPYCPLRDARVRKITNLRLGTETPLRVEPFVAWRGCIRGQLYNAFVECKRNAPGVILTDDEDPNNSWVNYSYGDDWGSDVLTRYMSLFLLKGQPVDGGGGGGVIYNLAY